MNTELIKENPNLFIEVNMIREDRTVDNFYIDGHKRKFTYNKHKYVIDNNSIYVVSLKNNMILPTVYFYEENKKKLSLKFKNLNKGITGKALSLLYNEKLYMQLFYPSVGKYNFFVVVLSIVCLGVFSGGIYLLYHWYTNGVV